MKRENPILLGIAVLLAAVCLGGILAMRVSRHEKLRRELETAEDKGSLVSEAGHVTAGQEAWLDFYKTAQTGQPAAIRLVDWFSRDESGPARLYVRDLRFDGTRYILSGENGNLKDGGPWEAEYRYLLYFPDVPAPSLTSTFESRTSYVLADDNTLTWEEIWNSWISFRSEGNIRTYEVYTEYVWRETLVNEDLM